MVKLFEKIAALVRSRHIKPEQIDALLEDVTFIFRGGKEAKVEQGIYIRDSENRLQRFDPNEVIGIIVPERHPKKSLTSEIKNDDSGDKVDDAESSEGDRENPSTKTINPTGESDRAIDGSAESQTTLSDQAGASIERPEGSDGSS